MRRNLLGEAVSARGIALGCLHCPLDKSPGIRKIKGLDRVGNQKVFTWAMCPGSNENRYGMELVGDSGELLWKALKREGFGREDIAVQNVVRCCPLDTHGSNRDPDKRELLCCSTYNEEAMQRNAGSAVVHLILGDVAGNQLLGAAYKKDHPVLWYPPWDAYVVMNPHPAYIVRKGGESAGWAYDEWCDRLHAVRAVVDHPGRWGYVKAQNYGAVRTDVEMDVLETRVRNEVAAKRRVSVDIETGHVDGKPVILMVGFGMGYYRDRADWRSWRGQCRSVILDHPEAGYSPSQREKMRARVKRLIEDPTIRKALQNGSSDDRGLQELLGARIRGYDYDTQYGTYLRHSFLRSVSLESMTYRFLPEFGDYKDLVEPWAGDDNGKPWNFAEAPLERLVPYNCGDCDVTKRMEVKIASEISHELLQVYIHTAYTLNAMEKRGPWVDQQSLARAYKELPKIIESTTRDLQRIAEDAGFEGEFNIDSPPQVAQLLYDLLKMPQLGEGRSTSHPVMDALAAETGSPVPPLVTHRRALGKMKGTYLDGYARSAKMHGGRLATRFFLTGAATGRLRSGSGRPGDGCVNAQNIAGEPLLKNILVSDPQWRDALK
jgi:uracil-DNA glycosylase family 4